MRAILLSAIFLALAAVPAEALTLNEFLNRVTEQHQGLRALRESREAARERATSGEADLSPVLSLKAASLSDKKQPNSLGATELAATEVSLGLAKKFSTGTAVSLSAKASGTENKNIANPLFSSFSQFGQGALGVSVSQSLWKDGFGRGTRLRNDRLSYTAEAEAAGADLQARQILAEAEASFWDHLYLEEELKIRKASLDRALRILGWVERRSRDGIADRADVLNAEALVASRRLQLSMSEDEVEASRRKIADLLVLAEGQSLPALEGKIENSRKPESLIGGDGQIFRLDAWLAEQEALARAAGAEEAADSLRADLQVFGSYQTNSFESGGKLVDGTRNWSKTETPTYQVGLSWTWMFETDAKNAATKAPRLEAEAAKLRAERKNLEAKTAWKEMLRRHQELGKKINSAEQIHRLQSLRSKAEQDKLSKGRSVTANVINAEQDAAEAELQWMRLQAEQRKLEAQTRMFIRIKE